MHEQIAEPPNWVRRGVDSLLRHPLVWLLTTLALSAIAWPIAAQLQFDQSIESLYGEDDPHLRAYLESKRLFGGDEFVIVAWQEPGLFEQDSDRVSERSAARLGSIAEQLAAIPGIDPDSIQQAAEMLAFPYQRHRVAQLAEGVLFGSDRETTAVVARLKPEGESTTPRAQTLAQIRKLAGALHPPAVIVGEPVHVHEMFRLVEEDGRLLFLFSLGLLGLMLIVLLRSLRWVVFPLLVVLLSTVWTEAILVLCGAQLSMVSSMLNSLVTIIGVQTSMHVAVIYRDMRANLDRRAALRATLSELCLPLFWTSITTSWGFGVLISSHVTPVRSFGLMMALASMLVFLATLILAPLGILTWKSASVSEVSLGHTKRSWLDFALGDPAPAPAEQHLVWSLAKVAAIVDRHPKLLALVTMAVVTWASYGLTMLDVETDFSRNFRDNSELVRALDFVETRLGGAGTWEVNFRAPASLDDTFLSKVRTLTQRLRDGLGVGLSELGQTGAGDGRLTKVISLTDGLDLVPEEVGIGFLKKSLSLEQRLNLIGRLQGDLLASLYNPEERRMRIVLRGLERQRSETKLELIHQVQRITAEVLGGDDVQIQTARNSAVLATDVETTGLFVLLTFLIESLLRDQLVSSVLATIGIAGMMIIALRSVKIGLISMVPNMFPITLVVGAMGWLGIPINVGTAMIACVSMGLTVDSSIVYLTVYMDERRQGASVAAALAQVQSEVGRAVVFTNAALVVGFVVLTTSHFIPLVYFGILVSLAMIGGLAGNLFILPLLLRWFDHDEAVPQPILNVQVLNESTTNAR